MGEDKAKTFIAVLVALVWALSWGWNLLTDGRYQIPGGIQAAMMGVIAALIAEPQLHRMARRNRKPDDDDFNEPR